MRPLLKYGVPAAAGLATGGYALSQGEDPGSAALAAGLGGLGAAAGLVGARQLAGKYSPQLATKIQRGLGSAEDFLSQASASQPNKSIRAKALLDLSGAAGNVADAVTARGLAKGAAAAMVPASALTAGLGGVAAGAVPGALGVPGFQQAIDPEMPGSSNTLGARMSMQAYPGMYA
ncbi:MAG: hypothetical protein Tp158DCM1229571_25 [Prokaryotic dsDNA virus sp.]|nr:MAG: hypothetical protein Tp158DCM1229571_25 [Prokaryotic dsDNA virus sp.]|tara:strand:- start:60886 stop:61413 length:528 start_codon:yes stop_codon:yes gene_type:complete